jgi:hypothetical protein
MTDVGLSLARGLELARGQHLAPERVLVQAAPEHRSVHRLELEQRERLGQELEANGRIAELAAPSPAMPRMSAWSKARPELVASVVEHVHGAAGLAFPGHLELGDRDPLAQLGDLREARIHQRDVGPR